MNKFAALLIASALISPGFGQEAKTPVKKEGTSKVAMKKPMAKKAKAPKAGKKAPIQSSVSSLHNPDDPWQLPT
jgi:hypothetical protein